jgi:hypothetical protein
VSVKQAAPGNYPAQCFAQRQFEQSISHHPETNHTLGRSWEPPVKKKICGHPRAKKK